MNFPVPFKILLAGLRNWHETDEQEKIKSKHENMSSTGSQAIEAYMSSRAKEQGFQKEGRHSQEDEKEEVFGKQIFAGPYRNNRGHREEF